MPHLRVGKDELDELLSLHLGNPDEFAREVESASIMVEANAVPGSPRLSSPGTMRSTLRMAARPDPKSAASPSDSTIMGLVRTDPEPPEPSRPVFPRVILSGHAKLPQDSVARARWQLLTVVVSVDPSDGAVLELDSTLVTSPARRFVRELLVGRSLAESPVPVLHDLQKYYAGGAKKALVAAITQLYDA